MKSWPTPYATANRLRPGRPDVGRAHNAGIGEDVHQVLTLEGSVAPAARGRHRPRARRRGSPPRAGGDGWRITPAAHPQRRDIGPGQFQGRFSAQARRPARRTFRGSGALSGPPRRLLYSSVFCADAPPPPGCGTLAASRLPRKRDHAVFQPLASRPTGSHSSRPRRHMPTAASASAPPPPTKKASTFPAGIAAAAILIGVLMSALDSSIVNIALPTISADSASAPPRSSAANGYQVASAAAMLTCASLGSPNRRTALLHRRTGAVHDRLVGLCAGAQLLSWWRCASSRA